MAVEWQWGREPVELGRDIERFFGQRLRERAASIVNATGIEAAARMKRERPWRDVSGNARRGLRCETQVRGSLITLYFIHSVEYGVNLELGHAGRYAVIVPTMHKTPPRLIRRLRGVVQ